MKGRYTSFAEGVQGQQTDHRCLWVDIALTDVFGHITLPLMRFAGQRVKSSDPRIVNKFNTSYKRFVLQNKLSHRIFRLEQEVTYPIQPRHQQEAEDIARLRSEGIQFADK